MTTANTKRPAGAKAWPLFRLDRQLATLAMGLSAAGVAIGSTVQNPDNTAIASIGFLLSSTSLVSLLLQKRRYEKALFDANVLSWIAVGSFTAANNIVLGGALVAAALASWLSVARKEWQKEYTSPDNKLNASKSAKGKSSTPASTGVIISRDGTIERVGHLIDANFSRGDNLIDRIHVGHRVSFLSALADVGDENVEPRELVVLVNVADADKPQNFQTTTVSLAPTLDGLINVGGVAGKQSDTEKAKISDPKSSDDASILAVVSHELRTPLNAIIGFSDLLKSDLGADFSDAKRTEFAQLINDAGTHLLGVVNTILDVSKIDAGSYAINPEEFDFSATASECVAMLQSQAEKKNIVINQRFDRAGLIALADRRAIKQVLINLLSNSIKYTEKGGVITVDATVRENELTFEISDTGIGMDEVDLKKIGKPFAQFDRALNREKEGTGLGLSLVKGLVELHHGKFSVRSKKGVGTQVTIILPTAEVSHNSSANDKLLSLEALVSGGKKPPTTRQYKEINRDERKFG